MSQGLAEEILKKEHAAGSPCELLSMIEGQDVP